MDARQESELDRREELARTLTGAQVEYGCRYGKS